MDINKVITIEDLRSEAKRRLPRIAFDFIDGGVEAEHCLARNQAAFQQYRMLPRYLVDVSKRSRKATLFGRDYANPFGICPTGVAGLWRTGADIMLADEADAANIPFIMSCAANESIEEAVKRAPRNMWFQLYTLRDRAIGLKLVEKVRDLGVETLVITVDVPVRPKRERNMRNGFTRPLKLKLSTIIDGLTRPAWLAGYLRAGGGTPMLPNISPYVAAGASPDEVATFFEAQTPASTLTWTELEHYRKLWPGNLVVKGILHPEDAIRATEMGADGIIVSNHGGRQLDTAPSPLEVLPAIRAAVGEQQTVMIDSGIRRGSDILIALCLGAQFAFVGRSTLYGVAAYGRPGVRKAIDILQSEIDTNMAQLGCASLDMLGPHCLMTPPSSLQMPAARRLPAGTIRHPVSDGGISDGDRAARP